MRFAVVAALTGAALAHKGAESTLYSTSTYTVTSCAASVTNCPARSTVVSSSVIALTTSTVLSTTTKYANHTRPAGSPAGSPAASVKPTYSSPAPAFLANTTAAPVCPTYSVKTISTSVTTVVPTVLYETVSIPCPTRKPAPAPSAGFSYKNATSSNSTMVSGAGSNMASGLFVAAAGLAAVALL